VKPSTHTLRALATGALLGAGLSLARAPLGVELALTPALSAGEALTWRALALGLAAFVVGRWGGPCPRLGPLAWGAALGFGLHGLVLADLARVTSRIELYALLALLGVAGWWLRSREVLPEPESEPQAGLLERLGLLVAGAGAAVALEAVARSLRLLGNGTPADDAAFATAFLTLLALGAVGFGPLVPGKLRAVVSGPLLALTALVGLEPLQALETFSTGSGLGAFLVRWPWQLDISDAGRLSGDLLLGARLLLPPAFLLGLALAVTARGARLGWALFGAALGLLALPTILVRTPIEDAGLAAWTRLALGTWLAGVGGALAAWGARGSRPSARLGAVVTCALAVTLSLTLPRPAPLPLSPWARIPVRPEWVVDTPEGLLTLEPTEEFGRVVTLDRRRLTPTPVGYPADAQRLRLAWQRVEAAELRLKERRVLLVGQLTPERAQTLRELGATHVDRTAAWHAHMARLEELLFDDQEPPRGRILAPQELGSAGPWLLVVAPPVEGAAPLVPPAGGHFTPRVVWIDARAWCSHLDWGERAMLSSEGIEELSIAPRQPRGLLAGERILPPAPWRRLRQRPFERERDAVVATLERLADGSRGGPREALTEGLARLAAAQEPSSPFETRAQATELDVEGLRLLREAALAAEPDLFVRELWNALAWLLVEKREIERIQADLGPLAERWAPWWQLDLALARADMESLDPGGAAEHLLRAVAQQPLDLQLRQACAEALSMAGRPAEAVEQLRAIDAVQPGRRDVRRLMAMELARAGDPEAEALLEELLAADPTDDELRAFQGPGPFPPPQVRFQPHPESVHDHDEDG
jgi:hypothetical protein